MVVDLSSFLDSSVTDESLSTVLVAHGSASSVHDEVDWWAGGEEEAAWFVVVVAVTKEEGPGVEVAPSSSSVEAHGEAHGSIFTSCNDRSARIQREGGREWSRSSTRGCEEALVLAAIRGPLAFENRDRPLVRWILVRMAEQSLSVAMTLVQARDVRGGR